MAFSLHRKKTSPYWFAYVRYPDPKNPGRLIQTSKSTKERTKEGARKKAAEIEQAILSEAGAGEEKSRELYAILKEACDDATRGNLNEAKARVYLSEMLRISTGEGARFYTLRQWLDGWLADKEKANKRGTFIRYKGVIAQFLEYLPEERTEGSVMNLTAEDIRNFRDAEHDAGKSASTVNDAVKTIRTALNEAKRRQVILSNPADAVSLIREDEIEKDVFASGDILRLIDAAPGDWPGVILFGFYTGMSLRDITGLKWSQIDMEHGTVSYNRIKTGTPVILPIHPELSEHLLTLPAGDDPKQPVFPSLAGKSTAGKSGLSMAFGRIMKKAGLAGEAHEPRNAKGEGKSKGRTRNTLTFHSLRHSFNSAMANKGVAPEIRNKLVGHASEAMNARYTHLELDTYRHAINAVPTLQDAAQEQEGGEE